MQCIIKYVVPMHRRPNGAPRPIGALFPAGTEESEAEGGGYDPIRLAPAFNGGFKDRCGVQTTKPPSAFLLEDAALSVPFVTCVRSGILAVDRCRRWSTAVFITAAVPSMWVSGNS